MITEVATVTETILIYFFFVTKTMKRLVPKVLENTYHVYSYKVQLVYNYIYHLATTTTTIIIINIFYPLTKQHPTYSIYT